MANAWALFSPKDLTSLPNNVHVSALTVCYLLYLCLLQPVARFSLPTANSVLLSALEWGEVMVVKDTVTYFGRNAGGAAVRDLFLPDRQMVRGSGVTTVSFCAGPSIHGRILVVSCASVMTPLFCACPSNSSWDISAVFGKAVLQDMAAYLAALCCWLWLHV